MSKFVSVFGLFPAKGSQKKKELVFQSTVRKKLLIERFMEGVNPIVCAKYDYEIGESSRTIKNCAIVGLSRCQGKEENCLFFLFKDSLHIEHSLLNT